MKDEHLIKDLEKILRPYISCDSDSCKLHEEVKHKASEAILALILSEKKDLINKFSEIVGEDEDLTEDIMKIKAINSDLKKDLIHSQEVRNVFKKELRAKLSQLDKGAKE